MRTAFSPIFLLATFACTTAATAQDAHYWTYGYGPIGQLTLGTQVGGVSDLSAVYYNPGALAQLEDPRFLFGLTSVELASIEAAGAAGPDLDFDSLVFDVVPSIVAGRVGGDSARRDHFAFAFLSRHDSDWDLGFSKSAVSAASPVGAAGYGRVRARLVEYWVGFTWSHRLSDRLSVGVSPFVAYRAQRSRRFLSAEESDGEVVRSAFVGREFEYNHGRALAKLGVAWRPGRWQLGATVTTPGVHLVYDSGKVAYNASVTGGVAPPLLAATTQKGLDATYHSPWSVAGGATWKGARTALHATVEWFSTVEPYVIIDAEPAPIAGSPATVPLTFVGAARSVTNFGVGFERRLGTRFTFYGAAGHNASPWTEESETFAAWDLTDVTGGVAFDRAGSRVALGVGYSWGSERVPVTIPPPGSPAATETTLIDYGRWTFSVGFSLNGPRGR